MRKLIVCLLFITTFSAHVHAMDKEPEEIILPEEITDLIIFFHMHPLTPLAAKKFIHTISVLNKHTYKLANNPVMIRTIIGNLSDNHCQNNYAQTIATPGARNYLRRSRDLYTYFDRMPLKRIRELFELGADVNYHPCWQIPLLCKSQTSLEKTKLLLELGANPNTHVVGAIRTPLSHAISTNNIPVARLLLAYPLDNKCIVEAAHKNDSTLLELILQTGNVSVEKINEALKIRVAYLDENCSPKSLELLKVLCDYTKIDFNKMLQLYNDKIIEVQKEYKKGGI